VKYFLDTSSLVKIYHKEQGSEIVIDLYKSSYDLVISELSVLEFTSTAYRKFREKEIDEKALGALIERFQFDAESRYKVLIFSSIIIEEAIRLVQRYGRTKTLRSLDSIQLAFFETYCDNNDIFVCSDVKLSEIVKLEDYKLLMP